MIIQNGLSLIDRIAISQIITTNSNGSGEIDIDNLTHEEKIALAHWWQITNKKTGKQNLSSLLDEISKSYKDNPDGLLTDLNYLFETDPIKDAIVDAAITKAHLDQMRNDSGINDAVSKSNTQPDDKEIISILLKRKIAENQMRAIALNRLNNPEVFKPLSVSVENTDPRASSTNHTNAGAFSAVYNDIIPVVESLSTISGIPFNNIQKEVIATQLTTIAIAGGFDISNPQQLATNFTISAAEVNPTYAQQNPINDLYDNLDTVIRAASEKDVNDNLTAAQKNTQSRVTLITLNQKVEQTLLNSVAPDAARAESTRITRSVAAFIADNPQATPEQVENHVNTQIKALTQSESGLKISKETIQSIKLVNHPQLEQYRSSYATAIIEDIATKSGAALDKKSVAVIAGSLAQEATYSRDTDTNVLDRLSHQISKETGVDQEIIKTHIEEHIAEIQRIKQLNYSSTTINIPAGIAIDADKIDIKNKQQIKAALAQTLSNTQNLKPSDIDRVLRSKEVIQKAVSTLEQNKDFQITIRKIDTSAIYSEEQNKIYKAFFEAYKDEIERSRPTPRGVQTIVLISSLPHQTIISPTAVALANMGVTVDMFDKLLKDPSKSTTFQQLLKNHKNQVALLRDQLEQLEGSQLYQDLAPDKIQKMYEYSKLTPGQAAISASLPNGDRLIQIYNTSAVKLMADYVSPKLIPYVNRVIHPIDTVKDYFVSRAGKALSSALLGGKTISHVIGRLLVQGLAKLGFNVALGTMTFGVGLVVSYVGGKILKPFMRMAKDLYGEEIKARDIVIAPFATLGVALSGLVSLVSVSSVLSSGLLATMAASALLGLFIYITSFVAAPILSTIVHLESGTLGTAVHPYTGAIIEGCNPIWPITPPRPSGKVIQGPKGTFSHSRVEAIDITSPVGTQVVSISNGKVIFNQFYGNYGNNLRIESVSPEGNTYIVWYGHLAAPSPLNVGDTVKIGDPIALSGATSSNPNFANPHLHLEYRGMSYNQCPAGGVPIPVGCYGFTECGKVYAGGQ